MSGPPRNSLAVAMLCAWNNVKPSQAPPEWANHPSDENFQAWERVAAAAREFMHQEAAQAESLGELEVLVHKFSYYDYLYSRAWFVELYRRASDGNIRASLYYNELKR